MLTLDLGNSRTKVCAWEDATVRKSGEFGRGEEAALASFIEEAGLARAALSSVAGESYTREIVQLLTERRIATVLAPKPGLANLTRTPETVGLDRLYAGRGALAELGRACLVCDLGTALTVDAVLAPVAAGAGGVADASCGSFVGGAIAIGPDLAARALSEYTANLPQVELEPGVPALGRDTVEALRAGCVVGIRGAARELLARIAEEAGLTSAPVCVTGGGRAYLLEPTPFTEREVHELPELVHRGVLEAARAAFA